MTFQLSKTSIKRLNTCHEDLQKIMKEAIKISNVDFGIAEGHRSVEQQKKYYEEGKSKIDGVTQKGKHNYKPSMAVDIYAFFDGEAQWDHETMSYLAGIFYTVAEYLYKKGEITHKIRWGGNWNMNGTILLDQSFDDRPHYELIKE